MQGFELSDPIALERGQLSSLMHTTGQLGPLVAIICNDPHQYHGHRACDRLPEGTDRAVRTVTGKH